MRRSLQIVLFFVGIFGISRVLQLQKRSFCTLKTAKPPARRWDTDGSQYNLRDLSPPSHNEFRIGSRYRPSKTEQYLYDNMEKLKYTNNSNGDDAMSGCAIWRDANASSIHTDLHQYRQNLIQYWAQVKNFSWIQDHGIGDLRRHLLEPNSHDTLCPHLASFNPLKTNLNNKDLGNDLFFASGQLSYIFQQGGSFVEPLLPPMRHPNFCLTGGEEVVLSVEYLVHDFVHMCRRLTPQSRIAIFDLGASPHFSGTASPWFQIVELYQRFGFKVDHIYAYEVTPFAAEEVMRLVPREFHASFHWINAGVNTQPGHVMNPWTLLETEYTEDDLVIVKLDIDTSSLEVPLAHQLSESPRLQRLVDQFYFEHHVEMKEMIPYWAETAHGTIQDTMDLFHKLRMAGVAAHFWV